MLHWVTFRVHGVARSFISVHYRASSSYVATGVPKCVDDEDYVADSLASKNPIRLAAVVDVLFFVFLKHH